MIPSPFPRLRAVDDERPASWLRDRSGDSGSSMRALVPAGFEAYARILHPAESASGASVRWATAAAWAGREIQPDVPFSAIAEPVPGAGRGPRPWDEPPHVGDLDPASLSALCDVLARHTATPERCWFCLWDGWGWIGGSPTSVAVMQAARDSSPPALPTRQVASRPEQLDGPRVRLHGREYLLFEGPLDAATQIGDRGEDYFFPQSPNLLWPDDYRWCVITDIDLDYSYLGGSAALVADLAADMRLEIGAELRP